METLSLARNAMATRFEIVLHGENLSRLRGAAEEALAEVERIEAQLSLFRPSSEIARINARAAFEPVRVSPVVFRLLEHARQLHRESGGVFDITLAPLLRCWGFLGGSGSMPDPAEVALVRRHVGMEHVILDGDNLTVCFDVEGVMLDLGAIGKGHAIDQAVATLREAGVASALLHGGTSTVYGIGTTPGGGPWKVAVESPPDSAGPAWYASVPLRDEALSVSAVWGKFFTHEGKTFGHVLDPRAGAPVSGSVLAAVALPSATETDALSTALLVHGAAGNPIIASLRPGMRTLVVDRDPANSLPTLTGIAIKMRESIEKTGENG
jgi:thiamine biosynthesis lipoprotein